MVNMSQTPDSRARAASKADGGWLIAAEKAIHRLAGVPHGQRETKLREIADDDDVEPNTVRRYVAAAEALPTISDKTGVSAKTLSTFPLASVEALARWVAYDKRSATKAANAVLDGKHTARTLVAAEMKARRAAGTKVGNWGKSRKESVKARLTKILKPRDFEPVPKDEIRTAGVDLLFRNQDRQTVAVLVFGPYQDDQAYKQRRTEFVQRLLGLGGMHDQVIAAIPVHEHFELQKILDNFRAVGWRSPKTGVMPQENITFYHIR